MPASLTITRPTFNDNDTLNAAAFNAVAISSAVIPDAAAGSEGVIRLAGDIGGTAAAPKVVSAAELIAGSVGTPSLKRSGQSDGIYFPSNGALGVVLAGAEHARFDGRRLAIGNAFNFVPLAGEYGIDVQNADDNSRVAVGEGGSYGMFMRWLFGGAAGGAEFGTLNRANNLHIYAKTVSLSSENLDFALRVMPDGNILNGPDSALATNAIAGFIQLRSMAGAPVGVATPYTGHVPLTVDTSNGRLYAYYGGAWHYVALT